MKLRHKIGFGLYLLNTIMCAVMGFIFFFSSKMAPWDAQTVGKNLAELDQGIQIVILAFMQCLGAAEIIIGFLCLVLLLIPFRRGENWANWTLFLGMIFFSGLMFIADYKVFIATNAASPWPLFLIAAVLGLLGFLFSRGMEKEKK
jgi:hypothetical protein